MTLQPKQFIVVGEYTAEEQFRLSVKRGLELNFFKSLEKFEKDGLHELINERYPIKGNQEVTPLIEATLNGHMKVINYILDKFNVNVNATGKVKHFGSIVDGVTALWCAADSGCIEIVKILIENGANVDSCTTTKSTPLRAACYIGRVDIVKYLIGHGANVNITNIFNSTCLMIASYRGYLNVVKYLLKNGADINIQNNCGATAMHFAAQADNIRIIKLLLEYNAQQLKNKQSLTPILVAAERANVDLVYYLLEALNLTCEEKIEVEELLGASFLNYKDAYDNNRGFSILLHSMKMRYNDQGNLVIPKKVYEKVGAYNNQVECQTIEDLINIKDNAEALHYESLIIREKILGVTNPDLLQSIILRGAVYASSNNFTPCIRLWNHALNIAQNNNLSIHKDLLRFTQMFCQMIKANINIKLLYIKCVLKVTVKELRKNKNELSLCKSPEESEGIEIEYNKNISLTLGLIIITSITLAKYENLDDPLIGDVMKLIVEINRLNIKTRGNQTLLHLCLKYDGIDRMDISTMGICRFPNYLSMKLLIYCGADVDAIDNNKNTPLHYIGKFILAFPHLPDQSKFLDTKKMVMELLNAGAHTDVVNKFGECPHTGFLRMVFNLTNKVPRSLKCLSTWVLKNNFQKELYYDQLPMKLKEFIDMH